MRFLLRLSLAGVLMSSAQAQRPCTLVSDEHYQCDGEAFAKRLADATLIRVETGRMDLFAADRTGKLVRALGKQVAAPDQAADLTFEVAAVDWSGHINLGPADFPLARLNVYDARHRMVWVETLDGQGETPWSADVVELLKRFQAEVAGTKI